MLKNGNILFLGGNFSGIGRENNLTGNYPRGKEENAIFREKTENKILNGTFPREIKKNFQG